MRVLTDVKDEVYLLVRVFLPGLLKEDFDKFFLKTKSKFLAYLHFGNSCE